MPLRSVDLDIPAICGVPSTGRRSIDSAVASWSAAMRGATDYWIGTLAARRMPADMALDGLRWWQLMTERRAPRWASDPAVVRETRLTRLRDFSAAEPTAAVATLVLPPQAGHDSCIVDYSREQSQMQTIKAAGLDRLYSMDWVGATQATKDTTISDYLAEVHACVKQVAGDGKVNLVGDCQGGWLATMYAALHPERANTLTIAGAPIDFHAGEPIIHEHVEALSDDGLSFYRGLVAQGDGVLKGDFLLGGFIVIKPENEIEKQLQLLANMRDLEHVTRYEAFEDWFKHTQDIAGPFYLWLVEHLFRDNQLIAGTLEVDGAPVRLSAIDCPVNLLGGATDHITPPAQVFALADHVSTPKSRITRHTSSGGHLGLFMGGEALREHWPVVMAEVLKHSRENARPKAAARRSKARTPRKPRAIPAP